MSDTMKRFQRAAKLICYCPHSGSMKWLPKADGRDSARWNSRYANRECGTIHHEGYRIITFGLEGKRTYTILAHRLAWFIAHGVLPNGEIDHINQDKLDNRLSNLRDVSCSTNQRNKAIASNNTSGAVGVTWHRASRKWQAKVSMFKKTHHLGLFAELPEAEAVVRKFRLENGFTEMHGRPTP